MNRWMRLWGECPEDPTRVEVAFVFVMFLVVLFGAMALGQALTGQQ